MPAGGGRVFLYYAKEYIAVKYTMSQLFRWLCHANECQLLDLHVPRIFCFDGCEIKMSSSLITHPFPLTA